MGMLFRVFVVLFAVMGFLSGHASGQSVFSSDEQFVTPAVRDRLNTTANYFVADFGYESYSSGDYGDVGGDSYDDYFNVGGYDYDDYGSEFSFGYGSTDYTFSQ